MTPRELVQRVIELLAEEERDLVAALAHADLRLARVRLARAALLALNGDKPVFTGTLSQALKLVLHSHAGSALTPLVARDALAAIGYDLTRHPNIMASIHSVLKRFVDTKHAIMHRGPNGSTYRWAGTR